MQNNSDTHNWYTTPETRQVFADARDIRPELNRQNNNPDVDILIVKDNLKNLIVRIRSSDGKTIKTYEIDMKYVHEFLSYLEKGQL